MLPYGCPIAQMACCVGHCRLLSVHLRDKCHLWWQWAPFAESAHISSVTLRECVVLTLFFSWDTPFAKGVLPEVASIIFFFILLKSHSISECHLCNRRLVNSCSGPLTCPLLFHSAQKSEAESCDFCVVLFIEQPFSCCAGIKLWGCYLIIFYNYCLVFYLQSAWVAPMNSYIMFLSIHHSKSSA